MASVKFRLRSKANKNVSIKIYLSTGRGNKFLEVSTGFTINPKDWSEATSLPKQNNSENKVLSNNLKKLETFILNNLNKDLANSILIDSYWLEKNINDCFNRVVQTDAGLLVNHIQYIIDNANTRKVVSNGSVTIGLKPTTIKNYKIFKNRVLEYEAHIKRQIRFVEITKPFIDKFTNWLVNTKKYSTNYSGRLLEALKTVCKDAGENEIEVTPFSKTIQNFRENDKDRYIQTLSFAELEQIKNSDFTNQKDLDKFKKENPELTNGLAITTSTLNNARNWILLGCEIGQRGGDLLNITNENIRYKGNSIYIDVLQQKTNKNVTIPIIASYAIDIVENELPIKIQHQKLNELIKVVCKIAGINTIIKGRKLNTDLNRKELGFYPKYELITSHCFRRSFATNYYKKIPTPILINITGHSKESLFLQYINQREDKDSNADLFRKFYEDMQMDKKPVLKIIKNGTTN
ncbi:phage integrase SAM-like domain-containing protein [Flavobacterium luteolum]|uniref:phage integrase SAM-like domain-containing protein n=1 Tax=Flavobacterium luteolum TaxID=3003259 RepID=UPI00248F030E|nr:phage integrase SAM-like domain-containing protein [Flavobacterium luteolum]